MRSPSTPGLGSSVTSNRSIGHALSALASLPPVPGLPDQLASARSEPGAAGCAVQDSETRPPVIPEIAHSTCGQIAAGAECTKTTPRVTTIHLRSRSNVLPQRGVRPSADRRACCCTVKLSRLQCCVMRTGDIVHCGTRLTPAPTTTRARWPSGSPSRTASATRWAGRPGAGQRAARTPQPSHRGSFGSVAAHPLDERVSAPNSGPATARRSRTARTMMAVMNQEWSRNYPASICFFFRECVRSTA